MASSDRAAGEAAGPPAAADAAEPGAAPGVEPKVPAGLFGWIAELRALVSELPELVADRVELLVLELRRASVALAQIVALIVIAAILGVTAWLALWAGLAVLAIEQLRWHPASALAVVLLANLAAAWLCWQRITRLAPLLQLSATRRHLRFNAGPRPEPVPVVAPSAPSKENRDGRP